MANGVSIYGPKIISRNTPLPSSCDGLREETDTMIAVDPDQPRHLIATWDNHLEAGLSTTDPSDLLVANSGTWYTLRQVSTSERRDRSPLLVRREARPRSR